MIDLTPGQILSRAGVHKRFGGQTQSGISTPKDKPVILLFTGEQGEKYGYRDEWHGDIFFYTGEGRIGDMQFVRGNKAIRDHVENGKDLLLFKYVDPGKVQFIGEMVCIGYEIVRAPDVTGTMRKAIRFHLQPLSIFGNLEPEKFSTRVEDLRKVREIAQGDRTMRPETREQKRRILERSKAIKTYVLSRAQGRCEACGAEAPFLTEKRQPYLEVHHIRRLSDGGPDDPAWTIALCPNCHRRAHYSVDREQFNRELRQKVLAIEAEMERILAEA